VDPLSLHAFALAADTGGAKSDISFVSFGSFA